MRTVFILELKQSTLVFKFLQWRKTPDPQWQTVVSHKYATIRTLTFNDDCNFSERCTVAIIGVALIPDLVTNLP